MHEGVSVQDETVSQNDERKEQNVYEDFNEFQQLMIRSRALL